MSCLHEVISYTIPYDAFTLTPSVMFVFKTSLATRQRLHWIMFTATMHKTNNIILALWFSLLNMFHPQEQVTLIFLLNCI